MIVALRNMTVKSKKVKGLGVMLFVIGTALCLNFLWLPRKELYFCNWSLKVWNRSFFSCRDFLEIRSDGDNEDNPVLNESSPLINLVHSDEHERTGTVFSSIFTLVSTMVGGGILSLPFAFQQGGFIMTSLILLAVLMASTHGAFLIINSKRYCQGKIKNVEDVAKIAFGSKGKVR